MLQKISITDHRRQHAKLTHNQPNPVYLEERLTSGQENFLNVLKTEMRNWLFGLKAGVSLRNAMNVVIDDRAKR